MYAELVIKPKYPHIIKTKLFNAKYIYLVFSEIDKFNN